MAEPRFQIGDTVRITRADVPLDTPPAVISRIETAEYRTRYVLRFGSEDLLWMWEEDLELERGSIFEK